jgi:hypothetical protein
VVIGDTTVADHVVALLERRRHLVHRLHHPSDD